MIHPLAVIGEPPEHRDHRHRKAPDTHTGMWFLPLIDETATIEALVTVDAGVFRYTRVGPRSWLMKHVHVGHDAIIGADCELAPGTVVCGECILEDGVKMGVNSCIKPGKHIGKGARIGAGAVVTKNVPAGEVWVGNPARPMTKQSWDLSDSPQNPRNQVPDFSRAAGWEAFDPAA